MAHRRLPYCKLPVLSPGLTMRSGAPLTDMISLPQRRNCPGPGRGPPGLLVQLTANPCYYVDQPSEAFETCRVFAPLLHEVA